jgi:hypothetical protein
MYPERSAIIKDMDNGDLLTQEGVKIVLVDRPEPGVDWRTEEGWGWIFKAWFRNWTESRDAMKVIAAAGWEPKFWGRKVRVHVKDGYDGERLTALVKDRWPKARIQLRND